MYNGKYIWPGIILFVVIFTVPFWINLGTAPYDKAKLQLPTAETIDKSVYALNAKQPEELKCIEPVEYMRSEHMQILDTWRDMALRDEKRVYVASDSMKYEVSLQNTCMKCHTDKSKFCDPCHTTNSVDPYCWDCHIVPEGIK